MITATIKLNRLIEIRNVECDCVFSTLSLAALNFQEFMNGNTQVVPVEKVVQSINKLTTIHDWQKIDEFFGNLYKCKNYIMNSRSAP